MTQDIYKAKLEYYEMRMAQARNDLTSDNILESVLDASGFVRQVVVY